MSQRRPAAPRSTAHPRPLSAPECRSWLESHREGRLSYRSGTGDRAVPVSYSLVGDAVVFGVPEFNSLLQYAIGEPVTFEVEERTGDDLAETVTVRGTAQTASAVPEDVSLPESWPTGVSTHLVRVPLTSVRGEVRRLTT